MFLMVHVLKILSHLYYTAAYAPRTMASPALHSPGPEIQGLLCDQEHCDQGSRILSFQSKWAFVANETGLGLSITHVSSPLESSGRSEVMTKHTCTYST